MSARGSATNRSGFSLVEGMIAICILSIASLSIAYMYKYLALVSVKTLDNASSTRFSEMAFSKLKSIEYYYLFDCDSALPSYGLTGTFGPVDLQKTTYPYLGVLKQIDAIAKQYRIDRWTVSIIYKIRDVSDVNGNGLTSDLRDFTDANHDKIDDYDPSIRYYKANADSDYYDTYTSTTLGKTASEVPDTNLKQVNLTLYRNGHIVYAQQELISLEMLSGIESRASGAELKLLIDQPANNTYLYDLTTTARAKAFAQGITKTYPDDVVAYRADTNLPLTVAGETSPLSALKMYWNSVGTVLDTRSADSVGNFSFMSLPLTSALIEGNNIIYAQATKDTYFSPYASRKVVLDLNPPAVTGQTPTGSVPDLIPYVGAVLTDTGIATDTVSGICDQVTDMKVNGSEVNFAYDHATGVIRWLDAATNLPPKLANGATYTVTVEGGDKAYYKVISTWTFSVGSAGTDNSAPSIANKVPSGSTALPLPEISCKLFDNQSGIDLYSITLAVDGVVVVSADNIASSWDAAGQRVFYTPPEPFASGSSHTATVSVNHWANLPADKKTSVDTWAFNVSY